LQYHGQYSIFLISYWETREYNLEVRIFDQLLEDAHTTIKPAHHCTQTLLSVVSAHCCVFE